MQMAREPIRSRAARLEQVDADPVLGQPAGERQADGPGADDRDVRHRSSMIGTGVAVTGRVESGDPSRNRGPSFRCEP